MSLGPPAAVTLGTRGSALALAQSRLVADRVVAARPGLEVSLRPMETAGDRTQASGEPLPAIGGKGLFTSELERALRDGEIDLAVHSLKDLPTEASEGIVVGAVCAREEPGDCLVAREGLTLASLPRGAAVGTSSLRRAAQLRAARSDLDVRSIRGNVDTRIRKVREGEFDAVVLAGAGVRRLALEDSVTEWLSFDVMLPAPGQGALAVQCRAGDETVRALLAELDDAVARAETTAERTFLAALGGGCAAPVAAYAQTHETQQPRDGPPRYELSQALEVRLAGLVASPDGGETVRVEGRGAPDEVGARLAREALALGADRILAAVRG